MDCGKRKIMVAMALAATAIGLPAADRQLYGATFEDVLNTDSGSMNDFSYVVNRPILDAAFRGIEDGEAFGWLGRSVVDEWNDDSTIAASSFRTVISFADGKPVLRWDPDLNNGEPGSGRVYRVEGKEKLSDDWAPTNSASRFFRVKVGMP